MWSVPTKVIIPVILHYIWCPIDHRQNFLMPSLGAYRRKTLSLNCIFRNFCQIASWATNLFVFYTLELTKNQLHTTSLWASIPSPKIPEIVKIMSRVKPKISFLTISSNISILGHMLLHKSYINVAITNILLYRKSRYDLPGPKYINSTRRESLKRAWPKTPSCHQVQKWYEG